MTEKFRSVVNCQQLSYRIVAKIAASSLLISWNEIYFKIESAIYISKYITNNDDYDQMFAVTKFYREKSLFNSLFSHAIVHCFSPIFVTAYEAHETFKTEPSHKIQRCQIR